MSIFRQTFDFWSNYQFEKKNNGKTRKNDSQKTIFFCFLIEHTKNFSGFLRFLEEHTKFFVQ